mmetsp:Transcript_33244/g.43760  ORF Transcript_33244/g.43760 Transcript_33244/m.43760 type:complete len:562 (+) Transcript_33244:125-1810(+)
MGLYFLVRPRVFVVLLLLFDEVSPLHMLVEELGVDSAHVDRVSQLLHLHSLLIVLLVGRDLLLQLRIKMILHVTLPIKQCLRHLVVFLGPEVRLARRRVLISVVHFAHAVHFHLLQHDFANRLLLLLPLDIDRHVETVVFFFESLQLFLIFDLTLLGPHELHFEALSGIPEHGVGILDISRCRSQNGRLVLLRVEGRLLDEFIRQRLLLLVLEADLVRSDLIGEHVRAGLQLEHVLIGSCFMQIFRFFIKLALDLVFVGARDRGRCLRCLDRTSLFKLVDELSTPFFSRALLGSLHIVTMSVREVIEPVLLIVTSLQVLEHFLLSHSLFDILAMFSLHRGFFLLFDLTKLCDLILVFLVIDALLFDLVKALFGGSLSLCLRLLHVLLHEGASVFARAPIKEKCALSLTHFLREEVIEGHLWQEFILLERLENFLLLHGHVLRATLLHKITSGPRELTVNLVVVDLALVESKAELASVGLEALALVPLLHGAVFATVARDLAADIRVGSHYRSRVAHLREASLVDTNGGVERLRATIRRSRAARPLMVDFSDRTRSHLASSA